MASQSAYPTVGASENGTGDGYVWNLPGGISGVGGDAASCSIPSGLTEFLRGTSFGFSIPSDATVVGVAVTLNVVNAALGHVFDQAQQLVIGGSRVGACTEGGGYIQEWPATPPTPEDRTYGGPTDLWGQTSITPAQVNASDFGASIQAWEQGGIETTIATVDYMLIEVYYETTPMQQARPDADNADGGWTTTPLWSKVDEDVAGGDVITGMAT